MGTYTVKSKSRKWTMVAFSYLLDTVRVNACTILALNQKKEPKKENAFDLDGIKGQHYKTKKNKISRIVSFCMKCKEHCCKKHSVWVCKNYSQ